MKVEVDDYAYEWEGDEPLHIGDRVLLPENSYSRHRHGPGPFVGIVTELTSPYEGWTAAILGKAEVSA